MNQVQVHWITLSLLIALSAILVNLSEWQLGLLDYEDWQEKVL